jgi:hypothetical protein
MDGTAATLYSSLLSPNPIHLLLQHGHEVNAVQHPEPKPLTLFMTLLTQPMRLTHALIVFFYERVMKAIPTTRSVIGSSGEKMQTTIRFAL